MKKFLCLIMSCIIIFSLSLVSFADTTNKKSNSSPNEILSKMTTEQKLAQMLMMSFRSWVAEDGEKNSLTQLNDEIRQLIKDYGFGGVCLFGGNLQGTEASVRLIDDFQTTIMSDDSVTQIPMLFSADQEGGYIARLGTGTTMMGNMALGAINDTETVSQVSEVIGSELKALGINTVFAPDMDINNNPANPIIGVRSFSDDPDTVSKLGAAYIAGIHNTGLISTAKHFPGHGNTSTDSHTGLPIIDQSYEEIKEFELIPFVAAIEAGVDIIMTAHIVYPQIETNTYTSPIDGSEVPIPATLSKTIITDILRNDMGYNGVISTDALDMDAIAKFFDPADAVKMAINAGVDLLLMPIDIVDTNSIAEFKTLFAKVLAMVNSGEIEESRLDESALRILQLKARKGILDYEEMPVNDKISYAKTVVGSQEHHELEYSLTQQAITLIKNDNLLPINIKDNQKVLILTNNDGRAKSSEYGILLSKEKGLLPENTEVNIFSYQDKTVADFNEYIENADYVIVSSRTNSQENMNPKEEDGWQSVFIDELISKAHELNKKVCLISSQLPYDSARYTNADAIVSIYCSDGIDEIPSGNYDGELETYAPNHIAVIGMLFGENDFTGTLPVNIMELDENYKFTNTVLYERGYGILTDKSSSNQLNIPIPIIVIVCVVIIVGLGFFLVFVHKRNVNK